MTEKRPKHWRDWPFLCIIIKIQDLHSKRDTFSFFPLCILILGGGGWWVYWVKTKSAFGGVFTSVSILLIIAVRLWDSKGQVRLEMRDEEGVGRCVRGRLSGTPPVTSHHDTSWEASPLPCGPRGRPGLPDTLRQEKLEICQKQTCFVNFLSCGFYFINILWKTTFIIVVIDNREVIINVA